MSIYIILVVVTICGKSPSVGIPKDVTVCLSIFLKLATWH